MRSSRNLFRKPKIIQEFLIFPQIVEEEQHTRQGGRRSSILEGKNTGKDRKEHHGTGLGREMPRTEDFLKNTDCSWLALEKTSPNSFSFQALIYSN